MPTIRNLGQELHFDVVGNGPPVVLGHSFLFSGTMWKHQVPVLADRFQVVNVDFRGHGRSGPVARGFDLYDAVGDVLAVLDQLEIRRAAWCGLSVGGMVALRAALEYPDRVSRLVLLDTDAGAEALVPRLKYAALSRASRWTGVGPLRPLITPLLFGRSSRRDRLPEIADWKTSIRGAHLRSLQHVIRAIAHRASLLSTLPGITVPALIMVGEEDRTFPPARAERMHAGLPDSRLVRIPGAGHLAALERPDLVNHHLMEFLDDGKPW